MFVICAVSLAWLEQFGILGKNLDILREFVSLTYSSHFFFFSSESRTSPCGPSFAPNRKMLRHKIGNLSEFKRLWLINKGLPDNHYFGPPALFGVSEVSALWNNAAG